MKLHLNERVIASLTGTDNGVVVSDKSCQNLVLVVRQSGVKTWQWRGRLGGQKMQPTLGNHPAHSLISARKWANEITQARDKGIDLVAQRKASVAIAKQAAEVVEQEEAEDRSRTCDWLFSLYMTHEGGKRKPSTVKEKWRVYNRDIKPHIGKRVAATITFQDLATIVRRKHEIAPVGSNGLVALIKRWFRWSLTKGHFLSGLETDPAYHLVKLEEPRDRDRFLTDYELRLFFKVILGMDSIMREPMLLILYTGVRSTLRHRERGSLLRADRGSRLHAD